MSYNAIIIDDEAKLREVLAVKIQKFCPEIRIVDKVENAKQAFASILHYKPDVVFLDIMMPEETGFELLNRFDEVNFEVIFTTGFNDYALDAFKSSAVDYLLKPINTEDLVSAANKAIKNIINKKKVEKYDLLKQSMDQDGDQEAKITISGNNAYEFVKVADIIRCEGWQKYTKVYLKNGECITSSYNIGVFKPILESKGFYSCHRSHLVNKKLINKYLKDGTIIMMDGSEIPVAKRKRDEFHNIFIKTGKI